MAAASAWIRDHCHLLAATLVCALSVIVEQRHSSLLYDCTERLKALRQHEDINGVCAGGPA